MVVAQSLVNMPWIFAALSLLVAAGFAVFVLRLQLQRSALLEKARTTRELVRSLYDRNPDPVVTYDTQGRIVRGNAAAVALAGSSPEALIGEHYSAHIAPGSLREVQAAFQRALGGEVCEADVMFLKRDGSRAHLLVMLSPVFSGAKLTGVHCLAKDVGAIKSAEDALARGHQRYRSIFEHHPDAVLTLDMEGRYVQVNAAFERITGYRAEEVLGETFAKLAAPATLQESRTYFNRISEGESIEVLSEWLRKDGTAIDVQIKACPIFVDGSIEGVYAFAKDITAQRRLERLAADQADRIRSLYMVASSTATSAEEQLRETLRFGAQSLGTESAYGCEHPAMLSSSGMPAPRADCVRARRCPQMKSIARHVYGARRPLAIEDATAEPWKSDASQNRAAWGCYIGANVSVDGLPWGAISFVGSLPRSERFTSADLDFVQLMGALIGATIQRDIQQRKLGELAFYDTLTGLPNRALLDQHLAQAVEGEKRRGEMVALHFMDLDGFKSVNDRHGHAAGDEILRQVALRLKKTLRGGDTVARVGGDEFVVVQPDLSDRRFAESLAGRMIGALAEPYVLHDGTTAKVGTSVGISLYPQDSADARSLLKFSDEAMYRVKESGKNALRFYH